VTGGRLGSDVGSESSEFSRTVWPRTFFLALLVTLSWSCHVDRIANVDDPGVDPPKPGSVTLTVSNQSFELTQVDITVLLDGNVVVDDNFEVGDQHNFVEYRFELPRGSHTLRAVSSGAGVAREEQIDITGEHWAYIGFLSRTGAAPRSFEFAFQGEPIYFLSMVRSPGT